MIYDRYDESDTCRTCGLHVWTAQRAAHHEWHNSMGQTLDLPPAPPTPKWREMVEENRESALEFAPGDTALGEVLYYLHRLMDGGDRTTVLARIVAIAEAEIGNGWQANPTCWWQSHSPDIDSLLDALNEKGADRWEKLGYRAAAWLRDLTDGGAA